MFLIKIICHTNIDNMKREEWPTQLPAVPAIGHLMASQSGKLMRICGLTWLFDGRLDVELTSCF